MNKNIRASLAVASTLMLTALLAACGGGGGGGGATPPTTGGGGGGGGTGSTPTPVPTGPTPTPAPTQSPGGTGQLQIGSQALANATVVFTCGCNGDGGKIQTDASGNYSISAGAASVLGNGTYTPTGNNLIVVGYSPTSAAQSWTMMFLGSVPAHNLNLSPTSASNTNDTASTAAALYVYYAASQIGSSDKTFDWFNFNQIIAFAQHLRTSPNATEQQFLAHITAAQTAGESLYPAFVPTWNGAPGAKVNPTITADVKAVANGGLAADATLPTPCPSVNGCANAPKP